MKLPTLALLAAIALGAGSAGNSYAADKVEFWTFSLKPKFTAHVEALVHDYEAHNPGVVIDWVDFPWDAIQTKLITRIVAGTPPALVNLNVPWADELARDGLLMPVDALIGAARANYLPSALEDLTIGGKLYGFPWYSNVAVIACNEQLFKAAGLHGAPRDLDEQLAFARQIAAKTGKAGFAPALSKIDGFFLQQGLPVLTNGRAAFDTPAHAALIAKLAASYQAGGLLKDGLFAEDNFPAVIAAYNSGRLGMLLAPPTALGRVQSDAPAIYAATAIAPAPLGPTGIADGGWLIHFAVPRGVDPKLLPAVAKFALYLTGDAQQLAFAKLARVFPTSVAGAHDPSFLALASGAGAAEQAVATGALSMAHSHTMYVTGVEDYDELRRVLVKAVESAVTGKQEAHAALAEAAAIWNRKLAKSQ